MDFGRLLLELETLNLPKGEFAITASGCLAVRGLRKASDLDIIVTKKLWNKLTKKHEVTKGLFCDSIKIGNIEILGNFSGKSSKEIATCEEQIETADEIAGFRFVKLELVKKFKKVLARGKDLKDIQLIDQYLLKTGN